MAKDKSAATEGMQSDDYSRYMVQPGAPLRLQDINPDDTGGYTEKGDAQDELERQRERITEAQVKLFAESKQSLLVILQAMDTGGKDGAIRGVFSGVNPAGCQVWSFKAPTAEELAHDFLWRYHNKTPSRGLITVFNRSHYEDVLIVRVKSLVPEAIWRPRYKAINDFEELLAQSNVTILKFYLHISKDEQKERLEARLADPEKWWKFNPDDLTERTRWDDYMTAFEEALSTCSTLHAPWYVVPSNKKWYRNVVIARIVADTLEGMDPHFPTAGKDFSDIKVPD